MLEEQAATGNGIKDDDQYPVDYEPRKIKRPPKKVLINVSIRQQRPGRFRLSGRWDNKRFYLYKGADRKPIESYGEAVFWKAKIENLVEKGEFDPIYWGKNPYQFDDAIGGYGIFGQLTGKKMRCQREGETIEIDFSERKKLVDGTQIAVKAIKVLQDKKI